MTKPEIEIREVSSVEELSDCVELQRKVFAMPDMEISPVRHLIVSKFAGGYTLAAFAGARMVGFVLTVPMFRGAERAFYSHMAAVDAEFQNAGIGARLKWAQRARALEEGVRYIKWTFQPVQARNAFFNLERLGATIKTYVPNFYGTDAESSAEQRGAQGVDSDRLFADWILDSPKVVALSKGEKFEETGDVARTVEIPPNWNRLVVEDTPRAVAEQERIKREFQAAFAEGLVAKGFERSETNPKYLLYKEEIVHR
jgi:predicted GNAT superfamily acetyltransferase